MRISRRSFVAAAAAAGTLLRPVRALAGSLPGAPAQGFDPWLEVDAGALAHNVGVVSSLTGGRPILAVVKNNAYGLGLELVARLLEPMPAIAGFAVVTTESAIRLRDAGVRKTILLMAMAADADLPELLARDIRLSLFTDDQPGRVAAVARGPVPVHLYLDTGMGRMGMPYHRALPWRAHIATHRALRVESSFTEFAEEAVFDREQLARLVELIRLAQERGLSMGSIHAASSNGVYHLPDAHMDMVRPGIALYGAYPSRPEEERAKAVLQPAVRLRARVVRVERMRPGDGASYGRRWIAERPTWTATLPVGHSDGYTRQAVNGARVLIGERLYPVIGAVSASHCIIEVGEAQTVHVGDIATLVGPDHPAIHPNALAAATGTSVYDVLMHLSPSLPRSVV